MAQAIVCRHSAIATHSTLRAGHAAFPIFGFRDGVLLFAQPGALPAQALEQVIEQMRGIDMDAVRAEIAKQEQSGEPAADA